MVKKSRRFKFDDVRQRFRLTPTEKRVALFVAAAFVLGLMTKCYRDAHPSPTPVQIILAKAGHRDRLRLRLINRGALNAGETTRRPRKSAEKLNLSIHRPNKSISKSNKAENSFPPTSCLRKTLFPQIIAE